MRRTSHILRIEATTELLEGSLRGATGHRLFTTVANRFVPRYTPAGPRIGPFSILPCSPGPDRARP